MARLPSRFLSRRLASARRHRAGGRRRRVAQAIRRHVERALSVSRREDAVVPRQPREGLLPLLRLRRRRRRDQVRRAAREGQLHRGRPDAGDALRARDSGGAGRGRQRHEQRRARGAAQGARGRGRMVPDAAAHAGGDARAQAAHRSRHERADDRGARVRLRAELARRAQDAPHVEGLRAADPVPQRPGRAARQRRGRRSLPWPPDDPDRARRRIGDRLRRTRDRGRSGAEVPELARNADLLEEPHAVRLEPHEGGGPEARITRSSSRATSTSRSSCRPASRPWSRRAARR